MTPFAWGIYFVYCALLAQGLGHPPATATSRPTPGRGPKIQVPRETQPRRALPTSQSTSSVSGSLGASPSLTSVGNATVTIHPACETVIAMISFCNSISPGFTTFSYTDQTPCLCYPNTTAWMPKIFDDAVSTCAKEISAIPSEYSAVSRLEGFCSRSGAGCNASSTAGTCTPTPSGIITATLGPSSGSASRPTSLPGGGKTGIQSNNISSFSNSHSPPSLNPEITEADLSTGQKVGIGLGGLVSLSLAGFCFYVALRPKKQQIVDERSGESGNMGPPQDKTTTTATEKVISDSPEVQEVRVAIIQRVTL